jgi:hypothetical protein
MFERYTDVARRAIFYARFEAAAAGSPYIESEHMLLGLLRDHRPLAARIPNGTDLNAIRKELIPSPGPRASTAVDLPLSNAMKRVLAYAAEDSERLRHRHIGAEHLVLGLLREPESGAARFLEKHGVNRAALWEEAAGSTPEPARSYNREGLHKLIDSLADDALQRAGNILEFEQLWSGVPRRLGRSGSGGGGAILAAAGGHHWSRHEAPGGAAVESCHTYQGREVIVRERFGLSQDGRALIVTVEVEHDGRRHCQTLEFDAPFRPRDDPK